jgi:hypothetical protein
MFSGITAAPLYRGQSRHGVGKWGPVPVAMPVAARAHRWGAGCGRALREFDEQEDEVRHTNTHPHTHTYKNTPFDHPPPPPPPIPSLFPHTHPNLKALLGEPQ